MKVHKYLIVLLVIVLVSCTKKTTTSNSRNDSVEKYLKLASIDTLPTETRKKFNHKAFSFIDLEKNDSVVRWYLCETALNSMNFKDSIDYLQKSKLHLKKSEESNDTLNLARFYRYRGGFHRTASNKKDSAYYYYNKSEKMFKKIKNYQSLAVIYLYKGILLFSINDFSTSELYLQKSESILKRNDNYEILMNLNCYKGLLFQRKLDYHKSIIFFKKGLKVLDGKKRLKDSLNMSVLLSNIAEGYIAINDNRSALFYINKAVKFSKLEKKDPILFNLLKINSLKAKGKLFNLVNYEKIYLDYLNEAKKINSASEIHFAMIELSGLYFKNGDLIRAQKYANQALMFSNKTKAPYDIINSWKQIGIVDRGRASEAIIQYDVLIDSLLNKERRERSKFLKIQLETDEIAQEKEKVIQQKWIQTSIITSILLIVILLFVIYKQQSQKKEFLLIQNQQKANEEIYQLMLQQQKKEEEAKQKEKKRIALELHDNVMNKLASTRFNLFTFTQQTSSENTDNAKQHIQTIKEIEDEIRNLTHELSKEHFSEDNSFNSIVTDLVHQQNQIRTTKYQLQIDEAIDWDTISAEIKMNLYRIIQESIHNCNKYANATQVQINLTKQNNQLQLSIKDNGVGFDVDEAKQGIGLHNMQQRIDSINGTITIHSKLGTGTEINCKVEIKS